MGNGEWGLGFKRGGAEAARVLCGALRPYVAGFQNISRAWRKISGGLVVGWTVVGG